MTSCELLMKNDYSLLDQDEAERHYEPNRDLLCDELNTQMDGEWLQEENRQLVTPRASRWSRTTSGGTVLTDPIFQTDFHVEYRLWSQYTKQKTHSKGILNLLLPFPSESNMSSSAWSLRTLLNDEKRVQPQDETRRLVDSKSMLCDDTSQEECDELGDFTREQNKSSHWAFYKGILYSSLSAFFFSLSAVIVKYLKHIHPGQLAVCRFVGIFILTIPMIVYHDLNPLGPPELRPILIMRGLAGATSLYLRFSSFKYLPIADASVIVFSVPVFVSIFAWMFLKEPCGLFQTFTIMIAMIGLMMTTKLPYLLGDDSSLIYSNNYYYYQQLPSNISAKHYYHNLTSTLINQSVSPQTLRLNHFYGVLFALSSLIFASAVYIFIRKAKGAHLSVIMFNFGWVSIVETTIITSFLNGFSWPRNHFEWYLIVFLAIFSFCGQVLLTRSLQLEQAGAVSVVRATTDITLSFLWQIIIFKETPDLWSIFGAFLVSSCIVLCTMQKWVVSLPEHSQLKAKLFFFQM